MGPTDGEGHVAASQEGGGGREEYPPGPHPHPPGNFSELELPVREVVEPLFRLFPAVHDEPPHFGRGGGDRFDAPDGGYGALYAAEDVLGAFIETFGRRLGTNLVIGGELARRLLARLDPGRPLRLVDLTGPGQSRAGVDARLFAGSCSASQGYSRAIHDYPASPDGVRHPARHDTGQVSVALPERARASVGTEALGALNEPRNVGDLSRLLGHYDQFGYRE